MQPPSLPILDKLLLHNEEPDPMEAASIQQAIGILTNEISLLRIRLATLESSLQKHRIVCSALRRFPSELLGAIFTFILPCCSDRADMAQLASLMLVCKCWKQAAYTNQRLWSTIHVHQNMSTKAIVEWYNRSGVIPKTLRISIPASLCCVHTPSGTLRLEPNLDVKGTEPEGCAIAKPALIQALSNDLTFEEVAFESPTPACYEQFLTLLTPSTRCSIKSLTLTFHHEFDIIHRLDIPSSVTSLDLNSNTSVPALGLSPSTYRQLTSFTYRAPGSLRPSFLSALRCCTSVESLDIDLNRKACIIWVEAAPVAFPNLRKLRLRNVMGMIDILQCFTAPIIGELDISGVCQIVCEPLTSFLRSSPHSKEHLRILRISVGPIEPTQLQAILSWDLPSLSHLILDDLLSTEDSYGLLTSGFELASEVTPHPRNFPALQALHILNIPADFACSPILKYAKALAEGGCVLRELVVVFKAIYISNHCYIRDYFTENDEELERHGISLSIEAPTLRYPYNAEGRIVY